MKDRLFLAGSLVVISISVLVATQIPVKKETPKVLAETIDVVPEQPIFNPVYDIVIKNGLRDIKAIALSFDADAGIGKRKSIERREFLYQPQIIKILEEENIPATIFVTGLWAKEHQNDLKELSQNRLFEIGNHSYSHPAFSKACSNFPLVADDQREIEIRDSQQIISEIIGYQPKLFRFPGGCYTKDDLALTKKYGLTVVHWDTDTNTNSLQSGSIILLHLNGGEIDDDITQILPDIITNAKNNGYTFVKIGELLSQLEKAPAVD